MLLRLLPPPPFPTILFTLSFSTLPHSLPLPSAWNAHLQLLATTRLASPPSLHALDKSVAWTALLDIVTFDLASLTVTCTFIDGVREEWPLTNRCVDLLERVIRDVNRSALEAEAEYDIQRRDPQPDPEPHPEPDPGRKPLSRSTSHAPLLSSEHLPPSPELSIFPTQQKTPKPKKRRSFLAFLMASLVPSSPSPVPAPLPSPAPCPSPSPLQTTQPAEDPECLITNGIPASRFLRRRARSTLVDAFRRFVVGELGARFRTGEPMPMWGGGYVRGEDSVSVPRAPHYALWVARSTMRRTAEEMVRIVDCAEYECALEERERRRRVVEGRGREDERDADDTGSASSTTDGSSVHTPLDFHDPSSPLSSHIIRPASQSHSPTPLTPEAYHAYVALQAMHHRLHALTCQLAAHAAADAEEQTAIGGEEVRSRRRAWSMKEYLRRADVGGANVGLVGLAVPVRSSPLCKGWTAEDVEREKERVAKLEVEVEVKRVRWESSTYGMGARSHEAEDVPAFRAAWRELDRSAEEGDDDDGEEEEGELEEEGRPERGDDDGMYRKRGEDEFIVPPPLPELKLPWPHEHEPLPQLHADSYSQPLSHPQSPSHPKPPSSVSKSQSRPHVKPLQPVAYKVPLQSSSAKSKPLSFAFPRLKPLLAASMASMEDDRVVRAEICGVHGKLSV